MAEGRPVFGDIASSDVDDIHQEEADLPPQAEEIPLPEQKRYFLIPDPVWINTTPWRRLCAFAALAFFDLAMNTAAGASAAAVGARDNGKKVSVKVVRLGALAGLTKSAMTTFGQVVAMQRQNFIFALQLRLTLSTWGICLVITAEMCNLALEKIPKELLIAAVFAAIPLYFETIRWFEGRPDHSGSFNPLLSICLIVSNALGGRVFAWMASKQGYPISNYSAASNAGAVFGTITFLARAVNGWLARNQIQKRGRITSVFGVYEFMQPERIEISKDERQAIHQAMMEEQLHFQRQSVLWLETVRKRSLRTIAFLIGYTPILISRPDRKRMREELEAWADTPGVLLQDYREMDPGIDDF